MADKKKIKEKTTKVANDAADFAQDNWKPILMIGGVALLLYFGKSVVDGLTGKDGPKETPAPDINTIPSLPPATITNSKAATIAAALFQDLKQMWPADDKVLTTLKNANLNHNDFVMVKDAFGWKGYDSYHGTYAPNLGTKKNLIGWLSEELNTPEQRAELKKLFPKTF